MFETTWVRQCLRCGARLASFGEHLPDRENCYNCETEEERRAAFIAPEAVAERERIKHIWDNKRSSGHGCG